MKGGLGALILASWIVWQLWGVEVIRPPWEDETDFNLPGANWAATGRFAIPQWGEFFGSDRAWRWHMPLFPVLFAGWVKAFGTTLEAIRLFTLLPAALCLAALGEMCARLAGARAFSVRLAWWALLLSDKTFIVNAIAGRMEFHATLCLVTAFALASSARRWRHWFVAGLALGVGVGFHPLAGYFSPALAVAAVVRGATWRGRMGTTLAAGFGFALPCGALLAWLLSDSAAFQQQFLFAVRASAAPTLVALRQIPQGMAYFYRFQPTLLAAAAAAVLVLLFQLRRREDRPVAAVLLAALGAYFVFLLRGSALHYYYYVPLTALLYLACARMVGTLGPRLLRLGHLGLALLLANNLAFAAMKTAVVWRNRDRLDPAPMQAFLAAQLGEARRVVVPPNLWLYTLNRGGEFRLLFTPIINLPPGDIAQFHQRLFAWRPEAIVLDETMLPPQRPSLTPEQVIAAGYRETGRFDRVFTGRYEYIGYRLRVFRRAATAPQ